jgi:glycolate oxidase FAD binding subunit
VSPTASEPFLPASLEEASALLEEATAKRTTLRPGEDLRLDRLARILQHAPGDLTCVVEGGVRLSQLHAALEPHGQRLSLDPPGDPTIGGCVAANRSGPLRHRFGAPRDLVLGVTLVLGDGAIASSGGTVVKNVAGYDLGKLACGSDGRLALIGRVALRLHPTPAASATLVVETDEPGRVVATLEASTVQPSALDVLHPGRVAVLFEGSPAAVDAQLTTARDLVGGDEADPAVWEESRRRQAAAGGSFGFSPGDLVGVLAAEPEGIMRPSVGVAYVPRVVACDVDPGVERLQQALRARFDPAGVFA